MKQLLTSSVYNDLGTRGPITKKSLNSWQNMLPFIRLSLILTRRFPVYTNICCPLAMTNLFVISVIILFQECSINVVIFYVSLWVWLLSLSVISLRIIQVGACMNRLSLFIVESYSVVCPYHRLFINLPIEGNLHSFQVWLLQIKLLWISMYKFLCEKKFIFLWDVCQECNCWVIWKACF